MTTSEIREVAKECNQKELPPKSWGGFIYSYRKLYGLTQEQLAHKLGLGRTSITMWETGRAEPSLADVIGFLAKLDMTLINYGRYLGFKDEN